MNYEQDPLREPLRLLRETSLVAGFEERLAERLDAAQRVRTAPVVRLPSRKRALLLLAAIVLPAAAAAASGYWIQQHAANKPTKDAPSGTEVRRLDHLPTIVFTANKQVVVPAIPVIEQLPLPHPHDDSKNSRSVASEPQRPRDTIGSRKATFASPLSAGPRIESLEPTVPRTTNSAQSTSLPKLGVGESLRKATEQEASRAGADKERSSQRDVNSGENRGNDAAAQARERVQARERKGQ